MCHGNNLSGGWANPTTPNEPVNYTGGLYSADLFLEHVIPEIEESPAFKEGGLIDASAAHPALATQGTTVAVEVPGGRLLATAAGPEVPEEGRFPVPATSPCTFIVTLTAATRAVPLDPAAFTFVDDLGHLHQPRVTTPHGGPPPRSVGTGAVPWWAMRVMR